jgi:hypothetical protein
MKTYRLIPATDRKTISSRSIPANEQLQELCKDMDNRFSELKQKASTDDVLKLEQLKPADMPSKSPWNDYAKSIVDGANKSVSARKECKTMLKMEEPILVWLKESDLCGNLGLGNVFY